MNKTDLLNRIMNIVEKDIPNVNFDYDVIEERIEKAIETEMKQVKNNNLLHDVSNRLNGYVAMNKNEFDIENMSFYKSKKKAERDWGNEQEILKIQIIFRNGC